MEIKKQTNGTEMTIALTGRLDTTTAPDLETVVQKELDRIETLLFDFEGVEYISSAGLRVLLAAQKIMNRQGSMVLRHVSAPVNEVFEITGFSDILTIE